MARKREKKESKKGFMHHIAGKRKEKGGRKRSSKRSKK
jgi:hypothetical protein